MDSQFRHFVDPDMRRDLASVGVKISPVITQDGRTVGVDVARRRSLPGSSGVARRG